MIPEFNALNEEEKSLVKKAPHLVSILIAGADNNIDKKELKEAVALSKLKQSRAREALIAYYKEIGDDFEQKLNNLIEAYPHQAQDRNPIIISELEKLNPILRKLDKKFAIKFYCSLQDIAKKVAEASGGLLGYMSVSYEESKLVALKMIKDPSNY